MIGEKIQLTSKQILGLLVFYASLALISAYVAQYVFDYQPCILCLYQRVPFFAVLLFGLAIILVPNFKKFQKIAVLLCSLFLLSNVILAGYHVGVEKKIFRGPTTCSDQSNLNEISDVNQLMDKISKTKAVKCDTPSFVFLGLSMAAWNLIYCLFLLISTLILFIGRDREAE